MKIRSQVGMVLNLDKCIGCHTCSVTCKNVWTSREGMEYAWFNNVESKPGIGYPKEWENQNICSQLKLAKDCTLGSAIFMSSLLKTV
jgi:nitrate reductase beta subunit